MKKKTPQGCGTWRSPITTDLMVIDAVRLGAVHVDQQRAVWLEGRPQEGGRCVLVCAQRTGETVDITPEPFSVRSRVHEYGGGAFAIDADDLWFCNDADQRIYHQSLLHGASPTALTETGQRRFADFIIDRARGRLIAVCEDHSSTGEPENTLVGIDLCSGEIECLVSGGDFYASPVQSPDGNRLVWLSWNHPNMPWDSSELCSAMLDERGALKDIRRVAGGGDVSIFQPTFSPDGTLYYVCDSNGFWNLFREAPSGIESQHIQTEQKCILHEQAEYGMPQWAFGMRTYGFLDPQRLVVTACRDGIWSLGLLDIQTGRYKAAPFPTAAVSALACTGAHALVVASSVNSPSQVIDWDTHSQVFRVLKTSISLDLDPGYISKAEPITFATGTQDIAHGFFYRPTSKDFEPAKNERPPLIVMSHGGPTGASTPSFSLALQFWTSRGFAVLDVNYRGSTGYGRDYRLPLRGQWGVVDVEDCVNGASYLASAGEVDGARLAIRGSSAGGFTTLAALTFHDQFRAGASYYGISELETLARDTHKFESRYLDTLVGPYPEQIERYRERSPIHHVQRLSCPVIFFQGSEDKVVPPSQALLMAEAVQAKGLPTACLIFDGEQHGFRKASTIQRTIEAELYFYGRVFGFQPADPIEPVAIENLD